MKGLTKHFPHYVSLIVILVFAALGFWVFSYNRVLQTSIVVAAAISYVAWGIVHHAIHDDLHLSVVIEYMAIAAIGLTLVLSLIYRA